MDPTCKLPSKCIKADESLEKCGTPACDNMIDPSCSKHLLMTFGEFEWEEPLFCGKHCFKHYKRCSHYYEHVDVMGDRPSSTHLAIISLIDCSNNFDMSDADENATKGTNSEVLVTNAAISMQKVTPAKRNAEGRLSLHKKPRSSSRSISYELAKFSLMWKEQLKEEKQFKFMQLSIEECKFKVESEREERKIGMLEHELSMKLEKLKAETECEWLNVDKEWLSYEKERLKV